MTAMMIVKASCTCGWAWEGPERAWEWISDRHAHAHNKGIDGLSACGSVTVKRHWQEWPRHEVTGSRG